MGLEDTREDKSRYAEFRISLTADPDTNDPAPRPRYRTVADGPDGRVAQGSFVNSLHGSDALAALAASNPRLRILVLNGCRTDGLAVGLARVVAGVIGHRGDITDLAALSFTKGLYSAHFSEVDPDLSGLLLHGHERFLSQKIERFVEGQPLVFLNACQTGRTANADAPQSIGEYFWKPAEGLASAFLYGGALGCVGSLWPVYDPAAEFAIEFYN